MYRVNNLLFVHTIFACIFGVKLKIFRGGYAPLTPHFFWGAAPPSSVIWKTPFKIPGYATEYACCLFIVSFLVIDRVEIVLIVIICTHYNLYKCAC